MKPIRGQKRRPQPTLKGKLPKKEAFDQEQENFDALQIEDHHDREYNQLLKSTSPQTNTKKNAYFFNSTKYQGTKEAAEESEPQKDSESEESEQHNQIATALKSYRQEKKKESKLLTDDVKQIDEEDQQFEAMRKKIKTSQQTLNEALQLKNQLNLENMLIDYRYNEQNTLESLKKYPSSNFPNNEELNRLQKELESSIFGNLNKLIEIYSTYSQKVLETNPLETYQEEYQTEIGQSQGMKIDGPSIHRQFSHQQEEMVRGAEKELIKWSNKTSLINVSSSHYSSLLMQTPVGQTKKILSNWDRVKSKCQQKRGTFRVLFQDEENVRNSTDPQIFDDFQLFTELQRGFISNLQDEADFRISDTMKYLRNRQNKSEKAKDVDRKASKNRKLRFNAHAKLLNFMPSYPANLIEARDEIVQNFFNCKAGSSVPENRPEEGETYYIDL